MITDDQIRANRERIAAKKSVAEESRTLFGYPVVEGILSDYQTTSVDPGTGESWTSRLTVSGPFITPDREDLQRGALLNDVARHALSIGDEKLRIGAMAVGVSREILEDSLVSFETNLFRALYEASLVDLSEIAHEWGLIDDDEAQRRRAEFNQRSIDASRAELREILIARGESVE
jgi:hypothetical protein